MAIVIREYDKVGYDNKGNPTPLAIEPGKSRTLTSGQAVALRSDTICVLLTCDGEATWDVDTAAAVDSTTGPVLAAGFEKWLFVKQRTGMSIEVTEA